MKKKKYILITFLFIIIDQLTKFLINQNIEYLKSFQIIKNFFYFTNAHNNGAAFSILSGYNLLFISITLIVICLIDKYIEKNISFYILLGGIIGNLIDRLIFGYVRDFLDFRIFNYNFPIFNISDICICLGIFLIIIKTIKEDKNDNKWRKRWKKNW